LIHIVSRPEIESYKAGGRGSVKFVHDNTEYDKFERPKSKGGKKKRTSRKMSFEIGERDTVSSAGQRSNACE
jgi:hypothetical protein